MNGETRQRLRRFRLGLNQVRTGAAQAQAELAARVAAERTEVQRAEQTVKSNAVALQIARRTNSVLSEQLRSLEWELAQLQRTRQQIEGVIAAQTVEMNSLKATHGELELARERIRLDIAKHTPPEEQPAASDEAFVLPVPAAAGSRLPDEIASVLGVSPTCDTAELKRAVFRFGQEALRKRTVQFLRELCQYTRGEVQFISPKSATADHLFAWSKVVCLVGDQRDGEEVDEPEGPVHSETSTPTPIVVSTGDSPMNSQQPSDDEGASDAAAEEA